MVDHFFLLICFHAVKIGKIPVPRKLGPIGGYINTYVLVINDLIPLFYIHFHHIPFKVIFFWFP